MLHDRQQLDVRVSHLASVGRQLRRDLAVGQEAVDIPGAPPGAEVHLVDRDRRGGTLAFPAPLHPLRVPPLEVESGDDGAGARRQLGREGERVRLVHAVAAVARGDVVLVDGPGSHSGDESLPDPGSRARPERMALLVPAVPLPHHGNRPGIRREDGEDAAGDAPGYGRMRPELLVGAEVGPLVIEVQIVVSQEREGRRRGFSRFPGRAWSSRGFLLRDLTPPDPKRTRPRSARQCHEHDKTEEARATQAGRDESRSFASLRMTEW